LKKDKIEEKTKNRRKSKKKTKKQTTDTEQSEGTMSKHAIVS